jgi:hypothetical protein
MWRGKATRPVGVGTDKVGRSIAKSTELAGIDWNWETLSKLKGLP